MIIELDSFDIHSIQSPSQLVSLMPFWSSLDSLGARTARLLIVTDVIDTTAALQGFQRVAVPEDELPADLKLHRRYYEAYIGDMVRESQYLRTFLIIDSHHDEQTLIRLLNGYGIAARQVDDSGVPVPFDELSDRWDRGQDTAGNEWGCTQSEIIQYGAAVPAMFHRAFALPFPIYLSIDVWNYGRNEASELLNNKEAVSIVQKYSEKAEYREKIAAQQAGTTIESIRDEIARSGVGLHEVKVTAATFGRSRRELEERLEMVRGAIPLALSERKGRVKKIGEMFGLRPPTPRRRTGSLITSTGLAVLSGSVLSYRRATDTEGILMGIDHNGSPVVVNQFDRRHPSYNSITVGQTGYGKSFLLNLKVSRNTLLGRRSCIIDPKGDIDYRWLGNTDDGEALCNIVRPGKAGYHLNILDEIMPDRQQQISYVAGILRILNIYQPYETLKATATRLALSAFYEQKQRSIGRLQHLVIEVAQHSPFSTAAIVAAAKAVAFALEPYVNGDYASLFANETTVNFDLTAPITVFDVSQLPAKEIAPAERLALFATTFMLVNRSIDGLRHQGSTTPIDYNIDEAGILMNDPIVAEQLEAKYKTGRSARISVNAIDQTLSALMGVPVNGKYPGREMLANAAFRYLFFQPGGEAQTLQTVLPELPAAYRHAIMNPRQAPGECVVQTPQGVFKLFVKASEIEKRLMSSHLVDKAAAKQLHKRMSDELKQIRRTETARS